MSRCCTVFVKGEVGRCTDSLVANASAQRPGFETLYGNNMCECNVCLCVLVCVATIIVIERWQYGNKANSTVPRSVVLPGALVYLDKKSQNIT